MSKTEAGKYKFPNGGDTRHRIQGMMDTGELTFEEAPVTTSRKTTAGTKASPKRKFYFDRRELPGYK
jgi:hypothetical protein